MAHPAQKNKAGSKPDAMDKTRIRKIALRTWLALLPLEFAACLLVYETIGEVAVAIAFIIALFFNITALSLYFFSSFPGIFIALSFGILLVGYQAILGVRLYFLNLEAQNIVAWAHREKEKTGRFPKDLTGYELLYPSYREYLQGYDSDGEEYMSIYYYVGTEGTSHYYDTGRGGWGYYPD
jgi:hypothetical protein